MAVSAEADLGMMGKDDQVGPLVAPELGEGLAPSAKADNTSAPAAQVWVS